MGEKKKATGSRKIMFFKRIPTQLSNPGLITPPVRTTETVLPV